MSAATQRHQTWLHRFATLTSASTLVLVAIGGLVTSHGVGMAVPDWPTSYGYNMFALPFSIWFTGGVFHEHTHRQWASIVGVLVVILARWLGGERSRKPIMIVGAVELAAGIALRFAGDEWRGAGGFLAGIGGVVLLAGIAWFKNPAAPKPLPAMGWWAFWLVQVQGLLGGLRVVLDAHEVAGIKMGLIFGIFHACLAQAFFVLLCAIALFTSGMWRRFVEQRNSFAAAGEGPGSSNRLQLMILGTTILIFVQLMIGATMRHQHAGLAIWDFPLAHGELWPATDAESIQRYNQQRVEISAVDPITAFHVQLQMIHRLVAVAILVLVSFCCWKVLRQFAGKSVVRRFAIVWAVLIVVQVGLGAWTVLSHKAADIATAHVVVGVLSLATGSSLCIFTARNPVSSPRAAAVSARETAEAAALKQS